MPKGKKGQRADGLIEVTHTMPDGKRRHFYGKSRALAEEKYRQALLEWHTAKDKKTGGATYREVADAYEASITAPGSPIRRGTYRAYRCHIQSTRDYFGDALMQAITPQEVREYLEGLKAAGKSEKTAKNARSVIKCVFGYWCDELGGSTNPAGLAKLPGGMDKGGRGEPTPEQIALIEAHTEGCGFWAALFEYTGLRLGEANGLQWEDVDFEVGKITPRKAMPWEHNQPYLEKLKTENSYRSIPILSKLRPLLERERAGKKPTDYVLSGTASPLTASQYRKRWIMYCRSLGLCMETTRPERKSATAARPARTVNKKEWVPMVSAHQFRHLYATNLFYAGVPDIIAQQLLGHSDIMTTRRVYQHLRDSESPKYIAALEQYLDEKS